MSDFPVNIRRYGSAEPLATRRLLRAGPLTLELEQADLRNIRLGSREILRRVYVAVRDRHWGTIMPVFSNWAYDVQENSFRVTFEAAHVHDDIDFVWKGEITGDATGAILYRMDGIARRTFFRNRIGFCVLYPRECAGQRVRIEHVDGTREDAVLPIRIDPDQPVLPFSDLRALAHPVAEDTWAHVELLGETFEMEDQRNWTDASYKIFGTPLHLPFPVEIPQGTRVSQSFRLSLEPSPAQTITTSVPNAVELDLRPRIFKLPQLGLGQAAHGAPLGAAEVTRLRALQLDDLRVDLDLADPAYGQTLERAIRDANAVGVSLSIALLLDDEPTTQLQALREQLDHLHPQVSTWLIYPAQERYRGGAPLTELVAKARAFLGTYDSNASFATGSNADYIFFARNAPLAWNSDAVVIAIQPQTHAFDNGSVMETLEALQDVIQSAHALAAGLPVLVSPITLKPRRNYYTTSAEPPTPASELPKQVDVRQISLFGAAWTAISLKQLAEAGASATTYFETTGWRGVMETAQGSMLPERFPSSPGMVFPLYHVLADVAERNGSEIVECVSAAPLQVQALVLCADKQWRLLVCNLTNDEQTARFANIPAAQVHLRRLNENTFAQATLEPEAFRASLGEQTNLTDGILELTLLPYETARVDWSEGNEP